MDLFVILTLVFFITTMFLIIPFIIVAKEIWYFIKLKYFRKYNYVIVYKFHKTGVISHEVVKKPDEVKFDKNSIFGMAVSKTRHFDAMYGLPVYIAIEGELATINVPYLKQDAEFLKLLNTVPETKKEFLDIEAQLNTIVVKNTAGEEVRLIDVARSVNLTDLISEDKKEDVFNALIRRAYELGISKGRNMLKNAFSGIGILYFMVGITMVCALAAAYYGYTNNDGILAINNIVTAIKASAGTIIGG